MHARNPQEMKLGRSRLRCEGFLDQAKTVDFLMCKKLNLEAEKLVTHVMLWRDFGKIIA